jgi:hypothetical protein
VINLYLYKAVGDLSIVPWKSAQLTVFLLERFRLLTRFPTASTTGPYRKFAEVASQARYVASSDFKYL